MDEFDLAAEIASQARAVFNVISPAVRALASLKSIRIDSISIPHSFIHYMARQVLLAMNGQQPDDDSMNLN